MRYLLNNLPSYSDESGSEECATFGGDPVLGSGSQRDGLKESEEGKMASVRWTLWIEVPIGVPAGMR